jgi:RNA polymerase sigma factor (sigma-70 family)
MYYSSDAEKEQTGMQKRALLEEPLNRIPASPLTEEERFRVYRDLQPLINGLIRRYGDTPELREDLRGEIFYRFCALIEEYDPERGIPLYAYLIRKLSTVTYAFARSQWRERQKREKLEVSLEGQEEFGTLIGGEWEDLLEQHVNEVDRTDLLHSLHEKISGLTERQRQVIIWRYYESFSFEEIAEKLNIKPATVRSLLRHALNNLRNQLLKARSEND